MCISCVLLYIERKNEGILNVGVKRDKSKYVQCICDMLRYLIHIFIRKMFRFPMQLDCIEFRHISLMKSGRRVSSEIEAKDEKKYRKL